ncbi:phage portal protein [Plantactinospora sp. WMMB782]|uniref:phage portal protein n=1 Tax=Plantactinospora sp. WMMB782 TaxID=3404121 RepID=UPI003B92A0F6
MTQPDPTALPLRLARQMLAIIERDRPRLARVDDYLHGRHDDPYMPPTADAEYRLLAGRAVTNMSPILVGTPAQALAVDNYRRGSDDDSEGDSGGRTVSPEWRHWQESRLDARQSAVHRAALAYGHSFTLTEKTAKGIRTKGLSPLRTTALYEDAANDDAPYAALTIVRHPDPSEDRPGRARMWDGVNEYAVTFKAPTDEDSIRVSAGAKHGATECPVTRFAAAVDLEGRTVGVVEPLIPLQNRINQTVFDLLVAQTYGSFVVRTATGMSPPMKTKPVWEMGQEPYSQGAEGWTDAQGRKVDSTGRILVNGEPMLLEVVPVIDPQTGKPIPEQIDVNARRFLFAADEKAKWGSLEATPLGGYIESVDMSIRHLSAIGQVPPHHLLGQIANLSAEALQAAETSLSRKVAEFRNVFGESWERVFRLAAQLAGDTELAENYMGEVIWRDMEMRSLSQAADGLGKLAEQLHIPRKGLWPRVPDVTRQELTEWDRLYDEEDVDRQMVDALHRSSAGSVSDSPAE